MSFSGADRRMWTDFEVQLLRELVAKGYNASEIVPQVGRCHSSVICKAKKLGLQMSKRGRRYALPPGDASTWNQAQRLCAFANVPLPLAEYVVACAEIRGVQVSDLRGNSRLPHLVRIRVAISKNARDHGYSYETIGRALNRDHTTIIHHLSTGKTPSFRKCSSEYDRIAA